MPCKNCETQFNIFKRKRSCISCCCYYCSNCVSKRDKNYCQKCHLILDYSRSKTQLMQLNTKDLKFFLLSRKINISGIVEKEELCNLIINHLNNGNYHGEATSSASSSSTPNNDFDNYAQNFDHIKQACQNIFTSLTDIITSDLQTTCFKNEPNQQRRDNVTTQQPRSRNNPMSPPPQMNQSSSSAFSHQNQSQPPPPQHNNYPGTSQSSANRNQPSTSNSNNSRSSNPKTPLQHDCNCSDDEIEEISEKRQSIFNAAGTSGNSHSKKTKLSNSSSVESSSFEEVVVAGKADDDWLFVEKSKKNATTEKSEVAHQSTSPNPINNNETAASTSSSSFIQNSNNIPSSADTRKLSRRRSDSSLLSFQKTPSITIDASSFNLLQGASEVKKIKISCRKCGKAKTKIKEEILKLSEQLKSSNQSEDEMNAKIIEFMDYLESNHASEMTETEGSQAGANDPLIPNSSSHDEIEENIFDENEGINVYGSEEREQTSSQQQQQQKQNLHQQPSCSTSTSTPKRFISLDDIQKSEEFESMNVKQLKEILMLNRVDFKGCCEKNELKERVQRLWESHVSAPPPEHITSDDLCKICMDAPIECVFLECGHTVTCIACGKVLSECPLCRTYIVRIVRIFKS